jgi:predicted acetyltransferase
MLHLEFPNISHKEVYLDLMQEWKNFEKTPTSPSVLFRGENFEEFLEIIENDLIGNRLGVPATLFFLMYKTRIIGAIQIRHSIEHPNLREFGGHIGYGIRPSERRK